MIIRTLVFGALVASLSGTALGQSLSPTAPPLPAKVKVQYNCSNLKLVVYYDNKKNQVAFVYAGKHVVLKRAPSADGGRYANNQLEWWDKGTTATLSSVSNGQPDTVLTHCAVVAHK